MSGQDKDYEVKLNYFIKKKNKKNMEIFFFILPGRGLENLMFI